MWLTNYYAILPAITILWSAIETNSLKCLCNTCPDNVEICEISSQRESNCFKSVKLIQNASTGALEKEETYGCFNAEEDSLIHLQCFTNTLKHVDPTFIGCCHDEDYCNEYIRDPPKWEEILKDNQVIIVDNWQLLFFLGSITIFILITLSILALIIKFVLPWLRSRNKSSPVDSSCFLEEGSEQSTDKHVPSSSSSTLSYSSSEDLCHKSEITKVDDSFVPDPTSGLGEQEFNLRTMAQIVSFGQTDNVGNGRFGRVFRGEYHGEAVAVKAFRTIDQESWKREDNIYRLLNHDNIVRFIASEISPDSDEIWMFLEYCPFGSLSDFLDQNEIMGQQQAVRILYSIMNGLNYLHEDYAQASRGHYKPSIAHRDIKSKNILMKTPDLCCIADFGHALIKTSEVSLDYGKYQHLQVGTIRYMAPEILKTDPRLDYRNFVTFAKADLYQYGLIMWEVCHRTALDILHPAGSHMLPYDGIVQPNPDIQDMIKIVCDDQYRPPINEKWNKFPMIREMAHIMAECWRPKSDSRMETLGIKKRLKLLYDQVKPTHEQQCQLYDYSLSPNFRIDCSKTKSSDVTL